jgi:hypothetical protein
MSGGFRGSRPASLRRRREPEHLEQAALFLAVRRYERDFPDLMELYAVPNGRGRSKAEAGKLWAEGVRPGRLDLNLDVPRVYRGVSYHGARIEMKRPGKVRPDPEQVRVMLRHEARGYCVVLYDQWRPAWNFIVAYLGLPTRLTEPVLPTARQAKTRA